RPVGLISLRGPPGLHHRGCEFVTERASPPRAICGVAGSPRALPTRGCEIDVVGGVDAVGAFPCPLSGAEGDPPRTRRRAAPDLPAGWGCRSSPWWRPDRP